MKIPFMIRQYTFSIHADTGARSMTATCVTVRGTTTRKGRFSIVFRGSQRNTIAPIVTVLASVSIEGADRTGKKLENNVNVLIDKI